MTGPLWLTPPAEVKPDRSELVLILGMLSLVTFLFPLGIGAWVWGQRNLSEMRAGRMDPGGRRLAKAGMICGIVNVLVTVVGGSSSCSCFSSIDAGSASLRTDALGDIRRAWLAVCDGVTFH